MSWAFNGALRSHLGGVLTWDAARICSTQSTRKERQEGAIHLSKQRSGLYGETGKQASHTQNGVDLCAIARGSGIGDVLDVADDAGLHDLAARLANPCGTLFARVAITPDGKKLYVANGRSNSISVIDTETNQKITDITVGELPWGVVIR